MVIFNPVEYKQIDKNQENFIRNKCWKTQDWKADKFDQGTELFIKHNEIPREAKLIYIRSEAWRIEKGKWTPLK